ncbi:hypothetical protein [Haloferula rosea]|uniref:Uncharacterized protein n=1 Tax=Haloferula rosea TaxID=490093 RepID=A0A934RGQ4_9BACT|nr:hypothetical protein [Haloferula rosea]MBK1828896.1 hypothetical protein [Haloferula rosea]
MDTVRSEKEERPVILERNLEWGEDYFNLSDSVNIPEEALDIQALEQLFGAEFSIVTPFYVNQHREIACCPVVFGDNTYLVTTPLPVGSRNNSVWGLDFYIREPEKPNPDTDMSISFQFDSYRRLVSIAYRGGVFGSTRQHFVDPTTIEPSVQLAATVRQSMYRALKGDGHPNSHWRRFPNFAEKFILAVDNSIDRK